MSRHERWIVAGLVLLSAVIVSRGSHGMNGAAPHFLAVSHSIAYDRDLDLRNQYAADGGYLFQPATTATEGVSRVGRDGGVYPSDGLGFSLAMVPVFVVVDAVTGAIPGQVLNAVRWNRERAARDLISFVMALLAAWTAVLTLRITIAVTGSRTHAPVLVVLAFITLPSIGASIVALVEIPAALLCAWFVLERLRPRPRPFMLALPLALLPWLHLRYAVIAIAGAVWACARSQNQQLGRGHEVVWLPATSVATIAALRWWLFGTLLPDLPADAGWMTLAALVTGLPSLLLDVDFGLLWVAPFWILSLFGLARVRRARPGFARFTGWALLGVLVVAAGFGTWRAVGPPAREWVPLLPLLAPFAVEGFHAVANARWRWLAYASMVWAAVLALMVLDRPARLWTEAGAGLGREPASVLWRLATVYSAPSRLDRMNLPLTHEAFVGRVEAGDLAAVDLYIRAGLDPASALVEAVRAGQPEVLTRLLEAGVAPDLEAARALIWAEQRSDPAMATALRAAGADITSTSARGETALTAAVAHDRLDEFNWLLDSDGDIDLDATTRAGQTALAFAAGSSRSEMLARLIAAGANVDLADADGWTPLMIAVRRANPADVRRLIEAGADVNVTSRLGWTALMWASYGGETAIVRDLLSAGADVNQSSKTGQSALIRAAGQGHTEAVGELLGAGADVTARVDGADAYAWAARNGHAAVLDLLARPEAAR